MRTLIIVTLPVSQIYTYSILLYSELSANAINIGTPHTCEEAAGQLQSVPAIGSLQITGCVHVHLGHWTGFMQGTAGYNAWQAAGRHPKDFASCRHPLV